MSHSIILPCAKGSEQVLAQEAESLGLENVTVGVSVVSGVGDLRCAYRLCLWSRVASRILWVLATGEIANPEDLYDLMRTVAWDEHLSADDSFAVNFNGMGQGINNTQFGAFKCKDAIVDDLREKLHRRPDVDSKHPDISIDVHLRKGNVTVALDLAGGSLHQRGYRQAQGAAPMKESLAATFLYRAQWPLLAEQGYTLIDPMCGSGTILLEAVMMAADIAPGLNRRRFGFVCWQSHIPAIWRGFLEEAQERKALGLAKLNNKIYGFDGDGHTLTFARENAQMAELDRYIHLEKRELSSFHAQPGYGHAGLIISNPPYGERLGNLNELLEVYGTLGARFKEFPEQWRLALITSNEAMLKRLRLRREKRYQAFNGPIEAQIVLYHRDNQPLEREHSATPHQGDEALSEQAQMFANRLRKNLKTLSKQAQKRHTNAYRVYDQDMPEYAVAIDLYDDHAHVQEYAPPATIDPVKAEQRLLDVMAVTAQVLEIEADKVVLKTRRKQTGKSQYGKQEARGEFLPIYEGEAQYWVNLHDYLDTGVFLDHRLMRKRLYHEAKDKRVLNLFCYTATASVQAALGGATFTTSVDLSQTYLDWAQRNFDLNGLSDRHRLHRADVMQWLSEGDSQFELIFCDPPTFSNTKKEQRVFDVQTDHVRLIDLAMARLVSRGTLYFSNNYRGFKLAEEIKERYDVEDISAQTIDVDFKRRPNIHQVWRIKHPKIKAH